MKTWIFGILLLLAMGCSQEDELTASLADKDYYVVEESDDPVQHELYLLYEKWGIPVFVNDTLGKEERGVDGNGKPIIYYHVLDLDYTIDRPSFSNLSVQNTRRSLIKNDEDKLAGILFLDNYLLPNLPEGLFFQSLFLTDSLIEKRPPGKDYAEEAHEGMTTLAIGWMPEIAVMSSEEKEERLGKILQYTALTYLQSHQDLLAEFYAESSDKNTLVSYYEKSVRPSGDGIYSLRSDRYEAFGFLRAAELYEDRIDESTPPTEWNYKLPDQEQDVQDFVNAIFAYTLEEFEEKYLSYELVRNKYTIMRNILLEVGYKLE